MMGGGGADRRMDEQGEGGLGLVQVTLLFILHADANRGDDIKEG